TGGVGFVGRGGEASMKHRRIIQAASTVLMAGALLMGTGGGAQAATTGTGVTTVPTVRILSGSACGASLYCFSPVRKTVAATTTVRWTNRTTVHHTVTRCN